MKLSKMLKVLTSEHLEEVFPDLLEGWDYDEGSIRFIRASQNFIFSFKHEGKGYILRLVDSEERKSDEIDEELDFISFVSSLT
jgi:Ser/Thr protein kinase RdoA (MazF antagonist)